jgi:hypothetical protein
LILTLFAARGRTAGPDGDHHEAQQLCDMALSAEELLRERRKSEQHRTALPLMLVASPRKPMVDDCCAGQRRRPEHGVRMLLLPHFVTAPSSRSFTRRRDGSPPRCMLMLASSADVLASVATDVAARKRIVSRSPTVPQATNVADSDCQ